MQQHLAIKTTCSSCRLRDICMPVGLSAKEMALIDQMVSTRLKIKRGEPLFRFGAKFKSLYTIRSGFFKTSISTADGREQVSGFYMSGELIGLDALAQNQHTCTARALEDSEVCVLHVQLINDLSHDIHALQCHVQKVMSREIVNDHDHLFMLGSMRADARLATFLLNLLTRLHARGQAQDELLLRMTREDIGSYLGLTIETISRTFSKMAKSGVISVNQRKIRVLQPQALHYLAEHENAPTCLQPVLPSHTVHDTHRPSQNSAYLI
jgi:CRP/FNR family transcriptional regulator, anaerobic regulatory protein